MNPEAYAMECARHAVGRIGRDDLAYTDDVIATLQSDLDGREMADALNIPDWDVIYHVQEVRGWSHRGTVLRNDFACEREWLGTAPKAAVIVAGPLPYPTDRAWWAQRTVAEAATALRRPINTVRTHVYNYGLDVAKPAPAVVNDHENALRWKSSKPSRVNKEAQRRAERKAEHNAGLEARNAARREARQAEAEAKRQRRAAKHAERNTPERIEARRLRYREAARRWRARQARPVQRWPKKYPRDPAWWAARTIAEIAESAGSTINAVRKMIYKHGLVYRRVMTDIYPTDPKWWAQRTPCEAAKELNRSDDSIRRVAQQHGYVMKRGYFPELPPVNFDPAWWAQRTTVQIAQELRRSMSWVYNMKYQYGLKTKRSKPGPRKDDTCTTHASSR